MVVNYGRNLHRLTILELSKNEIIYFDVLLSFSLSQSGTITHQISTPLLGLGRLVLLYGFQKNQLH
jgi:hypothetical protein